MRKLNDQPFTGLAFLQGRKINMEIGSISDVVTAVATVITALSIIIAAQQVKLGKENSINEAKRLKKQAAIDASKIYIDNKRPETDLMLQFVNNACQINGRIISDIEKFSVPKMPAELLDDVKGCIEFYDKEESGKLVVANGVVEGVSTKHVIQMRYLMIDYLNTLEAVLMYWWQDTANREAMEKEFSFLLHDQDTARPVNVLLDVFGRQHFPAIANFLKPKEEMAPEPTVDSWS